PIHELLDERPRERRRSPLRRILPARGILPVLGAILIPIGVLIFVGGPVVSEGFRRPGSPPFVIGILFVILAGLTELTALGFFLPAWPIALCMFVAWTLLANNAVRRLVRFHDEGLRQSQRGRADEREPVDL